MTARHILVMKICKIRKVEIKNKYHHLKGLFFNILKKKKNTKSMKALCLCP